MDDFISRDSVFEQITKLPRVDRCAVYDADSVEDIIRFEPAADVVEVVRCKDCRYYEKDADDWDTLGVCKCGKIAISYDGEIYPKETDFCSYGERRAE